MRIEVCASAVCGGVGCREAGREGVGVGVGSWTGAFAVLLHQAGNLPPMRAELACCTARPRRHIADVTHFVRPDTPAPTHPPRHTRPAPTHPSTPAGAAPHRHAAQGAHGGHMQPKVGNKNHCFRFCHFAALRLPHTPHPPHLPQVPRGPPTSWPPATPTTLHR